MSLLGAVSMLDKRDRFLDENGDNDIPWWYSDTALIVKWAVLGAILVFFLVFFLGGYLHAQRRMKKGLAPLAYHRWLIPYRQRAHFEPGYAEAQAQQQFSFYNAQNGYNMHPMPPPAYNPNLAPPPNYQPPEGASKTAPNQQFTGTTPAPYAGESSSAAPLHHDQTGSTNVTGNTNPYAR